MDRCRFIDLLCNALRKRSMKFRHGTMDGFSSDIVGGFEHWSNENSKSLSDKTVSEFIDSRGDLFTDGFDAYACDHYRKSFDCDNIVKRTCKELGITQKELAERIGYKVDTVNKAASSGKISEPLKKAIDLLREVEEYRSKLAEYENLKKALKKAIE